jgi:hypothetical protein
VSEPNSARIWRIDSAGNEELFATGLNFPNGISFHLGGVMLISEDRNLLVADTWRNYFRRGDFSKNGVVDITDSQNLYAWLFGGSTPSTCLDAADANDDARVDISDVIYILNYLFLGGAPPPDPGPNVCGTDPTIDLLGCRTYRGSAEPACTIVQ